MSSKDAEGFLEILNMVRDLRAFHQHVVHVYFHVTPDLVFEDLIDESLVGGSGIFQSEGYYFVAVKALAVTKAVCSSSSGAIRI